MSRAVCHLVLLAACHLLSPFLEFVPERCCKGSFPKNCCQSLLFCFFSINIIIYISIKIVTIIIIIITITIIITIIIMIIITT